MIAFDELQRWNPENQENFGEALEREIEELTRFKELGGVRATSWMAPAARRYLFLCADLDTLIDATKHVAWSKRTAAGRVRTAKAEAAAVVAEIEAKGWIFTSDAKADEVWVYHPAATWESDDELHQIQDELTAMAERLAAPLIAAYDANWELNRQTNTARRATRRFMQPASRDNRIQPSRRPAHRWSAHRSGHREILPKQRRCEDPRSESDGYT